MAALDVREAAFVIDGERGIRLKPEDQDIRHAGYLAHAVARRPGDLVRHVQRIHFHLAKAQASHLYAALVDLYIALGRNGEAIRRRMLDMSREHIPEELAEKLQEAIVDGLLACHKLGDVPGSVLGRPVGGALDMVVQVAEQATQLEPLDEARALIDEGRIDEAASFLENALLADPNSSALADELLAIHRSTRNSEGVKAIQQLMEQIHGKSMEGRS